MEISYNHDKKFCTVWLTNAEKADAELRESLKPLYTKNKADGYLTAVYESGEQELYDNISYLLKHNRRRMAESEVRKERQTKKSLSR